ncbi:type II toxin-antitoxin system death-on-curing family toxin [Oscillochloris sp. ZM17-4]|nr:type II toxin-antitoxin system death-on-curing family toxin [Oscillochloris sp. ZM17-4]MBX0331203.1 type II toxin-antitoxin system death-on-curing family toxin [Oscillochloris sp. ZM17-4]
MNYLTRDDLLDLHAYALERYGGLMGIKSQDQLQQVLSAPHQQMFGAELYPDLASKAAVMVYMLVKSHPFVGANDATALMALLRLLTINGYALCANLGASEIAGVFRALNHSDMDKEGLEKWLRESLVRQ